jgi:hypothetical protein
VELGRRSPMALYHLENFEAKYDTLYMNDFLFARPSVLEGIARNIDLFGVLNVYNHSQNGREADLKAKQNDIAALKNDFYTAYGIVKDGLTNKEA